jgi:hypothetical protein
VREFAEDGFIKIVFIRTVENTADMFTKNVNGESHDKHAEKFIAKVEDLEK